MLHSGSRNIGNKLAQCHIDTAKDLAKMADIGLPDRDLAYPFDKGASPGMAIVFDWPYLPIGSEDYRNRRSTHIIETAPTSAGEGCFVRIASPLGESKDCYKQRNRS